jgi:hypothetical protein
VMASAENHMTPTPNKVDYTALYQEIADYVIIKAHSGDPLFERIFESAWNKTALRMSKNADSSGPGK